jgi:type III secretory pathway component EscR
MSGRLNFRWEERKKTVMVSSLSSRFPSFKLQQLHHAISSSHRSFQFYGLIALDRRVIEAQLISVSYLMLSTPFHFPFPLTMVLFSS